MSKIRIMSKSAAGAKESAGVIALLDLPPGTSVTIDGTTQIIKQNDFIGVRDVPSDFFHLIVVRAAAKSTSNAAAATLHSVGFALLNRKEAFVGKRESSSDVGSSKTAWTMARRYDPLTEEVSAASVDATATSNLVNAIDNRTIAPGRMTTYQQFVSFGDAYQGDRHWSDGLVSCISKSVLDRRNLKGTGDKVVPGGSDDNNLKGNIDSGNANTDDKKEVGDMIAKDGIAVCYPPIPCIELAQYSTSGPPQGGIRAIRHTGTRRYLSSLTPAKKTALFLNDTPGTNVLKEVYQYYYQNCWQDLVGDLQLAYVLFLHLGCLSSFEHWRDLLSMLSFAEKDAVSLFSDLYSNLLRTLSFQMSTIEYDFFQDVEYSGGNFLVPALCRLYSLCLDKSDVTTIQTNLESLRNVTKTRFDLDITSSLLGSDDIVVSPRSQLGASASRLLTDIDSSDEELEDHHSIDGTQSLSKLTLTPIHNHRERDDLDETVIEHMQMDSDDEEDDPVLVTIEEIEASFARSAALDSLHIRLGWGAATINDNKYSQKYPLLFASVTPQEDILMTCARLLDAKTDVSLVREAAAYLEEVEANRCLDDD